MLSLLKLISINLLIFLIIGINEVGSSKILAIYPTPSISHQFVFRALTKALIQRGHEVKVITPHPMEFNNPNLTQIDLSVASNTFTKTLNFVKFREDKGSFFELMDLIYDWIEAAADKNFKNPGVQELLKNDSNIKFDLVIVEALFDISWNVFAAKFKAPLIGITSLDSPTHVHEAMGNVVNPVLQPDFFSHDIPPLTFTERWENLKSYLYDKFYFIPKFDRHLEKIIKKYLPDLKITAAEVRSSRQLLFTNGHPVMGFIRPIVPLTIQLGFMHIEPPKKLPEDLKNYLDSSKNGVIYMSLGSNAKSSDLNLKTLKTIQNVFESLSNFDVLWKWESDEMANRPKNVKTLKWLPQSDLLAHPKIKLFITHGGQQSLEEAIDRMVPMIAIPFLADQDTNAKKISQKKIGIHLDLQEITEESLKTAILEVMNPKYKENIAELKDLIYDQPMSSLEKAVWWTEYVIRHKNTKHLQYVGTKVPFYQVYCLDILAVLLVSFLVAVKMFMILVRKFQVNFKKSKKD